MATPLRAIAGFAGVLLLAAAMSCSQRPSANGINPIAPLRLQFVSGPVVWVSPAGDYFVCTLSDLEQQVNLTGLPSQTLSGAGIETPADLVAAFRRGVQLTAEARAYADSPSPLTPATITFTARDPSLESFAFQTSGTVTTLAPRFRPTSYHSSVPYVSPWTEFREDSEFASWDAVVAAGDTLLCVSGQGFRTGLYSLSATRIGVKRLTSLLVPGSCPWPSGP